MLNESVNVLARTIWGEARGQGFDGMYAVACVISNRVDIARIHDHFGDGSIISACHAPWQFSCWNHNDPNLAKLQAVNIDDPQFAEAVSIAQDVVNGNFIDSTNGATYYYSRYAEMPGWAVGKTPCATIGDHIFFKNIA